MALTTPMSMRMSTRVLQRLDELAKQHHTTRSRLFRLALAYAVFQAPEKWLPRNKRPIRVRAKNAR